MKRTRLRRKAKSHTAGWWQSRCDKLLQEQNRASGGACSVCGGKNEVLHHVITKALSSFLRYEPKNLVKLCKSCHFRHHIMSDPNILATLIYKNGQGWYNWLESVRRTPQQTGVKYYQEIYAKLSRTL